MRSLLRLLRQQLPTAIAIGIGLINSAARAQTTAPRHLIQIGFAQLLPLNSSSAVQNQVPQNTGTVLAGVPARFDSPGAALTVRNTQTLALTFAEVFSPRWAVQLDVGIPPVLHADGSGTVTVPTRLGPQFAIDLADPAINPLGSARLWAPVLQLQYRPRGACRNFCPYIGVGATYAWFTQEKLKPAFAERLNTQYGSNLALLAGKPGVTTAEVRVSPVLRPAMSLGMTTELVGHWGLTASAGITPLATDAEVRLRAADGSLLSTTRNRMGANAVVMGLLLSYGW